jgi:phosphoketolase
MEEIQYQRTKLKMNLERLLERSQQNHLLTSVVKDYQEYEKHMREQDEDHYKQMVMIQTYLEDIMETNQLTESGINQLNHEHSKILKNLDEVKKLSDAAI